MKPRLKRRPRPFRDLRLAEPATARPGDPRLFLGRLDEASLRRELEDARILARLAEKGYPDVVIRTEMLPEEHRLRLLPRWGRVSLVDLRLAEPTALVEDAVLRDQGLEVLSLLSVQWLSLQDPHGRFTPERPRLPGQRYPGLNLGKRLYERLMLWARSFGKDALVNIPEYFHNAVFYAELFRFFSPARQGRFEALVRDLKGVHVAEASAALEEGRVFEERSGRTARWESGEMAAPLSPPVRAALESPDYLHAVRASRDGMRFRLEPGS